MLSSFSESVASPSTPSGPLRAGDNSLAGGAPGLVSVTPAVCFGFAVAGKKKTAILFRDKAIFLVWQTLETG